MLQLFPTLLSRLVAGLICLAYVVVGQPALSQVGPLGSNQVPDPGYYLLISDFYSGNYRDTVRDFANTRGALRFGTDRYIDSVCYWTMAGECNYLTGNFPKAVEFYESALDLYLGQTAAGWHQRLQPPPLINPVNGAIQAAQINWGQSTRTFAIPGMPDSFQVLFGRLDNERVAQQGGVIQNPEFRRVDVAEVMRCTALALHRRRILKGVTTRLDPFSGRCVKVLEPLGGGDNTILGAWNGIALGIAYAGVEEFDKAQEILLRSLQFGGGMDHILTPVGLLELATIKYQLGELDEAASFALEASYSAAIFRQYDLIEEALSLGTTIHLARQRTVYPPLQNAIIWLGRDNARFAQTSLTIRLAECFSEAGDSASSANLLSGVSRVAPRLSNTLAGRVGYLAALNLFLDGNFDAGRVQLADVISLIQGSSRWIYQLGLADNLTLNRAISDRQSDLLYSMLLRDPVDNEWRTDPMEAMAFLSSDHLAPIERWFAIAIDNRDFEHAIEIAELLRRHRFYSLMPLAGRQLAFRWLMHAPSESVSEEVMNRRVDFLTRFPAYRQLCDQADQLQQQLLALPIQTDPDTDQQKEQKAAFVSLMKVSQQQEAALASFALRREPAALSFPPSILASNLRNDVKANQLVIYTVAAGETLYFFTIDLQGAKLVSWHPRRKVVADINQLFKVANLAERGFDAEMLADPEWKETAFKVAANWLPQLDLSPLGEGSEVIIVPDGVLWYAPFEMLRFGAATDVAQPLFDLSAIRYSPTIGLALQPQRPYKPWSRTAVFSGPVSNRFDVAWTDAQVADYQKVSPLIVNFPEQLDIPTNLFNTILDQVVVWTESSPIEKSGPFGVVPAEKDRGKNGSNIAGWMSLPFNGAEHVVLPCFAGAGDNGIRGAADGNEFFVISCALLSSGTRTLLISRWNVGGESALKATRQYLNDVADDFAPSLAWHRAAKTLRETTLDWTHETRMKPTNKPPELKGQHPLFWSGYMLFDVPTKHIFRNGGEEADPAAKPAEPPAEGNPEQAPPADGDLPDAGGMPKAEDEKQEPLDPEKKDEKQEDGKKDEGKDGGGKDGGKDDGDGQKPAAQPTEKPTPPDKTPPDKEGGRGGRRQ